MAKINRKTLEQLLSDVNDTVHDLGDLSFTYVLNYAKYEGGYALQKYTYDKSKLLRGDYITTHTRLSAREMYVYLMGVYNTVSELRKGYRLLPHEKIIIKK